MITILLADDHPLARAGIRHFLSAEPDLMIIGEAENGMEAQKLTSELHPQILLLDLKMPGPRPAEVEKWIRINCPETITLVLTAHDRDAYLAEMMNTGIRGYLTKSQGAEQLISAIRRAIQGEDLFTIEQKLRAKRWRETEGAKWEALTEREREILKLLCEGMDHQSISVRLDITERTIAYHITNLLKKLNVNSSLRAIAWAHKYFGDDI